MTKKSRQTLKYLENEKGFWGEIKSIFKKAFLIIVKGLSVPKIVSDLRVHLKHVFHIAHVDMYDLVYNCTIHFKEPFEILITFFVARG